jgi:hypothetical protein
MVLRLRYMLVLQSRSCTEQRLYDLLAERLGHLCATRKHLQGSIDLLITTQSHLQDRTDAACTTSAAVLPL